MTSVVLDNNYTELFLMAALNEKLLRVGHNEDSGFIKMRLERQQNCYLSTLYTTIMIHDHIILATPQMYGGEMLIDGPLVENQTVSFPSEEEYKKSLDVIEPLPLFCGLDELIDFLRESGVSISTDEFSRFEATLDEMETERTRRFGQRSVQDIKLENIVQRMLSGKNIINDDDLDFIDKYERWNRRWVQAERSIMELNSQIRRANDISGNILNSNLSAIRNRNIKEESYLRIASGKVIVNFDELDRNDLFRVAALQLGVAPYAETLVATLKMANSPEAIDFRLRIDELSQNLQKGENDEFTRMLNEINQNRKHLIRANSWANVSNVCTLIGLPMSVIGLSSQSATTTGIGIAFLGVYALGSAYFSKTGRRWMMFGRHQ